MLLAVALFSIDAIFTQIAELRCGFVVPDFSISCVDTLENRMRIIEEVAHLYGYFLTYKAHEKEQARRLRAKGIWLEVKDVDEYFPSQEQVQEFVQHLQQAMEVDLSQSAEWGIASTKLGVDYGPDKGALFEAFKRAGLDAQCNTLLPYKSVIYLEIKGNELQIHVWLKGLSL